MRASRAISRTLLLASLTAVAVCAQQPHGQDSGKAAEVNGSPILASDVDAKLGNKLAELQQQIYSLRQRQVETMIQQKLLEGEAAKRGVPIADLVQTEITSKVTAATPEEAEKFYKENASRLQGDYKSLEEQIRNYLTAQRLQTRQQQYLKTLRAAAKVNVMLTPPPIFRSEVSVQGAPAMGPANAPVTLIEFSDFHCPFCRNVQPALDGLKAKYGSKVRFVFRDFPLDNLHPQARAAAEASHCADEQGKFWPFHDKLFRSDADGSATALAKMAKEAGLDEKAFAACQTSGKYKASVQASAQEGAALGITGTPTFFINGRILVGAQDAETFSRMIEEELAAADANAKKPGTAERAAK